MDTPNNKGQLLLAANNIPNDYYDNNNKIFDEIFSFMFNKEPYTIFGTEAILLSIPNAKLRVVNCISHFSKYRPSPNLLLQAIHNNTGFPLQDLQKGGVHLNALDWDFAKTTDAIILTCMQAINITHNCACPFHCSIGRPCTEIRQSTKDFPYIDSPGCRNCMQRINCKSCLQLKFTMKQIMKLQHLNHKKIYVQESITQARLFARISAILLFFHIIVMNMYQAHVNEYSVNLILIAAKSLCGPQPIHFAAIHHEIEKSSKNQQIGLSWLYLPHDFFQSIDLHSNPYTFRFTIKLFPPYICPISPYEPISNLPI